MSRILFVLAVLALVTAIGVPQASAGTGNGSAHGYKWFQDDDGDGIPNGLDDDWAPPQDGSGFQWKHGLWLSFNGLYWGIPETGNTFRNQYRNRNNDNGQAGDCDRKQKQLRDGTCK